MIEMSAIESSSAEREDAFQMGRFLAEIPYEAVEQVWKIRNFLDVKEKSVKNPEIIFAPKKTNWRVHLFPYGTFFDTKDFLEIHIELINGMQACSLAARLQLENGQSYM